MAVFLAADVCASKNILQEKGNCSGLQQVGGELSWL